MDNDEVMANLDIAIRHLENAAELLSGIDGLERYAEELFVVMANLDEELSELESIGDEE